MASEASGLLAILAARGWSYRAIGQTVNRDPSLIRQGAIGKKPLNNLVPGLQQLVNSGKGPSARLTESIEPPRRLAAGGGLAKVRQPKAKPPTLPRIGERRTLPGGQQYERVASTVQARDFLAHLPTGKHVQISYKGRDGKWHLLGRKGGYRVDLLRDRLRGPRGGQRTFHSAVNGIADEVYGDDEDFDVVGPMELISV